MFLGQSGLKELSREDWNDPPAQVSAPLLGAWASKVLPANYDQFPQMHRCRVSQSVLRAVAWILTRAFVFVLLCCCQLIPAPFLLIIEVCRLFIV